MENEYKREKPFLEERGVHLIFPATTQSGEIGKACRDVGFEWDTIERVVEDLKSEVAEFEEEFVKDPSIRDMNHLREEMGDVYFALAQVCRRLDWEPELVAMDGNRKFIKRFNMMEALMKADAKTLEETDCNVMNEYWEKAKSLER